MMKNIDEILENLTTHEKNFNIPFKKHSNGDIVLMDPVIEMFDIDIEDPSKVVIITSHDVKGEKKLQDWLWNVEKNCFEMITKFHSYNKKSPRQVWKEKGINMKCPKILTKSSIISLLDISLILSKESHD